MTQLRLVVASDIGRVVTAEDTDPTDPKKKLNIFADNYLEAPEMPNAFEVLAELHDRTNGRVGLISKCGTRGINVQQRTREWLEYHELTRRTGIPMEYVFFCVERAGKGPIAQRLGVEQFVDDKLEVLKLMPTVKHRWLFQPREGELRRFGPVPSDIITTQGWLELRPLMLAYL